MTRSTKAVLWVLAYLLLVLAPLIILFIGPRPAGREFWRELSVALGFAGLSLMGLQFVPTARLPFLARVFSMDVLYAFHHGISLVAFGLIMAHPVLLFLNNPYTLRLLNLASAPWRARAGVIAVIALLVLIATSVWREKLKLKYEPWHIIHDACVLVAAALALYHIFKVDYHMSSPLQRALWIILAIVWTALFAYVRLIKPWLLTRKPWQVTRVIQERGATWTLEVEPVGHAGITFKAGQVAWLSANHSPFSIMEHPFSFSSSPLVKGTVQFTIRELGDFTATVKDLKPGDRVYLDGPYGVYDINEDDVPGFVFIAGGIGSAPVMSMLRTLADQGDKRPLSLIYGSRTWEDTTFREQIEELQQRLKLDVRYVLERPPEGWGGERGYLTREILDRILPPDRDTRSFFVCGPGPMIKVVEKIIKGLEIPLANVHIEQYKMA